MTKKEMLDASDEMKKESEKFYVKAFVWAAVLGTSLYGVVKNYALSSNHLMLSNTFKAIAEKEED